MKKLLSMLLVLALALCTLTGCAQVQDILAKFMPEAHAHEYSDKWSSDETNHWHAAICEAEDEGCDKATDDVAPHYDVNRDGACDVCGYDADHEHAFDESAFVFDAKSHWHASTCGHEVVSGEAAHTPDEFGNCTACGAKAIAAPTVVIDSIEKALQVAASTDALIENSTIQMISGYQGEYGLEKNDDYIISEFAENYLHMYDSSDFRNLYYTLTADGVFALSVADNGYVMIDEEATEDYMKGWKFYGIMGNYEVNYFGVTELIAGLYAIGAENVNGDFAESCENGVCSFSYLLPYVPTEDGESPFVYAVEVSFSFDNESYIINKADISIDKYNESVSVYSYDVWDYVEFVCYTVEDGVYALTEYANDDSVVAVNEYHITQSNEVKPSHSPADVIPVSYKFVDADGNEIDFTSTLNVSAGEKISIYVADVLPSTGIFSLLGADISFTDAEGNDFYSAYGSYNFETGAIEFKVYKSCDCVANIVVGDDVYTLNISAAYPAPESIEIQVYDMDMWDYIAASSIDVTAGDMIDFRGYIESGDPAYTYTITGGEDYVIEEAGECYYFTANAEGTYVITVTSVADATVSASLTVNVAAAQELPPVDLGDIEELLCESYENDENGIYKTLSFMLNDDVSGVATVVVEHPRQGTLYSTWDYSIEGGEFSASLQMIPGNSQIVWSITLVDGSFVVSIDGWDYVMTVIEGGSDVGGGEGSDEPALKDANGLGGKYAINWIMDGIYELEFVVDSEGATVGMLNVVDNFNGACTGTYIYTINEDGGYVFTNGDIFISQGVDGSYQFQVSGMAMPQPLVAV